MTEHESIRASLALAAAGALSPEELRQVDQHVQGCDACRRELDTWGIYTVGLSQLSQPALPQDLVERTQARIRQKYANAAEQRRHALMFGALAVFSWAVSIAVWALARVITRGSLPLLDMNLVSAGPWLVCSSVLAWITAATAAVVLSHQQRQQRNQSHQRRRFS